jgi:hypothetical protein
MNQESFDQNFRPEPLYPEEETDRQKPKRRTTAKLKEVLEN